MKKESTQKLILNPSIDKMKDSQLVVWSHDNESYKINFEFSKMDCPLILSDSKPRILLLFKPNNEKYIYPLVIDSEFQGKASFTFPEDILGFSGEVHAHVYLDFTDHSHDFGHFKFMMEKSEIDNKLTGLSQIYVHEFTQAVAEIKKIADEYEDKYKTAIENSTKEFNDLMNSWEEIGNTNELATKVEVALVKDTIGDLNYVGTNLWAPEFYKDNVGFYNISGILDTNVKDYIYTDYIAVNQIKKIWINVINPMTSGSIYILEYDKSKNFIARRSQSTTTIGEYFRAIGETTAFIKLDAPNKFGGKIKVELGNKATDYSISPLDTPTTAQLNAIKKEVEYSNRLIKKDVFPHFVMHRGYNLGTNIYPENSLQSFEASNKNYGCETDIRATKDGKFVCMHDATINRTTTGTGAVSELTLAQIRSFKLKTPLMLNSVYASQLVPTFEEFLAVMQKNGTVPFIEIKALGSAANYDAFCQVISSAGADNYGYVISFDYSALQEVRLRLPEMRLQFLSGTLDDSVINQILELGRCDADISVNGLTQEKVKKAHSNGIAVNAYTINSLDSIQKATAYGVDFITSDISQANDRMWEASPENTTNVNDSFRIGSHQYYVRLKEESKGWVLIDAKIDASNITNKTKGQVFLSNLPEWATPKMAHVWCDGFLRGVGSSQNYPTTMDILTTGELTVGFDWDKSTSWVSINHRYYVG
ncbi:glycerophosphodiester phosphodiesterase family protein [Vagococcus salmoninarum]|uniref:GP-PDE domain-containing protein n=1 Tax=Vagococcus salmoninarum TaxID=2739 RepID=A0A429ZSL4_9ENTE|nr:glycerophosphodiester phosphodiesterase family protein [Vagococcus salmoninarum]RST96665.1 hypothetical protein CBF35_05380 [Vagococcus salmoninarum]